MKCVVLAAGYATRLYPLTENYPKPLLEIGSKPIINWLLEDIGATGMVDEFIVVSNHKYATNYNEWAKTVPYPVLILDDGSTTNDTRLGAVRDIFFAIDKQNIKGDILVIAEDTLLDFSLSGFIGYAQKKAATCVMRYYEESMTILKKCGVAQVDEDDRITDMVEKPSQPASNWAVTPFYYYKESDHERIFEAIEDGCSVDAPGSYVAWLSKKVPVYAMEMPGRRYDIGDWESYKIAQTEYIGFKGTDV